MWLHKVKGLTDTTELTTDTVEGIYRVMKVQWDKDQLIGESRILLLSDSSSELEVYLPSKQCRPWFEESQPYLLRLTIDKNRNYSIPVADPNTVKKVVEYNPITLIPRESTPRPDQIIRLVALYKSLKTGSIKKFWEDVFMDELWLRLFLKLPASCECHHNYPGGLFIHSLKMAEHIQASLSRHEYITALEKDAAMSIALLHDATKVIATVGYPSKWKIPFYPRQHERYLPYFLSSALTQLQERDFDAWAVVIRMLDDYVRPNEKQNSPIPALIRNFDHMSAHFDARQSELERTDSYRNWIKICGRPCWLPGSRMENRGNDH